MQNQKRLKIAQPQTDRLRLSGPGAKPQQAETHSFRERGARGILRICITDALLAVIMPNLVQMQYFLLRLTDIPLIAPALYSLFLLKQPALLFPDSSQSSHAR